MDTTFATKIENDVTRNVLDTGARLFILEHAPETSAGYLYLGEDLTNGEITTGGWLMERSKYNEWQLSSAVTDDFTLELIRQADAIGYMGIHAQDSFMIFEIQNADYARSPNERTASYRLAILEVVKVLET